MATETILKEVAVIDEAIAIICERLNLDRISDSYVIMFGPITERVAMSIIKA